MKLRLRIAAWLSRGYTNRAWHVARHTAQENAKLHKALRIACVRSVGYEYRFGEVVPTDQHVDDLVAEILDRVGA